MDIPPQADSPQAGSTEPRDAFEKPAAAPKKATATQFFLKGLAIVLPPILTLVILVWIGQMIYGYVVSPVTTGVRFVIAEVIDKSRPTAELVPATDLPPLQILRKRLPHPGGGDKKFTPRPRQHAARLLRQVHKGRLSRLPPPSWPITPTSPSANDRSPTATSWKLRRRMRPNDWPATATGLYMELVTIRVFQELRVAQRVWRQRSPSSGFVFPGEIRDGREWASGLVSPFRDAGARPSADYQQRLFVGEAGDRLFLLGAGRWRTIAWWPSSFRAAASGRSDSPWVKAWSK